PLFTFHFSLFTVHCSLFTFHFSLFTFHFPLSIVHFSLPTFHCSLFTFHFSLPNTNPTKNIAQYIITTDLAGDGCQVMQCLPDVLCEEVVRDVLVESVSYRL